MKKIILPLVLVSIMGYSFAANACIKEGGTANGTVSPKYQTACCTGLKSIYPYESTGNLIVGGPSLCVNPKKGTPMCKYKGTKQEGRYYKNGTRIKLWKCGFTRQSPKGRTGAMGLLDGTESQSICTMDYTPVCASVQVQCIKAPCPPLRQTFSNICAMKANKLATFLYTGACKTSK